MILPVVIGYRLPVLTLTYELELDPDHDEPWMKGVIL